MLRENILVKHLTIYIQNVENDNFWKTYYLNTSFDVLLVNNYVYTPIIISQPIIWRSLKRHDTYRPFKN